MVREIEGGDKRKRERKGEGKRERGEERERGKREREGREGFSSGIHHGTLPCSPDTSTCTLYMY